MSATNARARASPVLSPPQRPAPERFFRPGRVVGFYEGPPNNASAWKAKLERRAEHRLGRRASRKSGLPASRRPSRRMAASVPGQAGGSPTRCARSRSGSPRRSVPLPACGTSTTTGWSRRVDRDPGRPGSGTDFCGWSPWQDLAQFSNTVRVLGVIATQMRSGIYLVDVLVRASAERRDKPLATILARPIPLSNRQLSS